MITAKEARTLYYKHKNRMKEVEDFILQLSETIASLSSDGKTTTFTEMPTDRAMTQYVTDVLTANGYGWRVESVKDRLFVTIWW